jgi:hypothetical protein
MTPCDIQLSSDGLRGVAITLISIRLRVLYKGCELDIESWAHQVQRLVKLDGKGWKLVRFQVIYLRDSVSTTNPGEPVPKLDEEEQRVLEKARESYKFLAWQLERNGKPVSDNMPGYDDESSWKPIMEGNKRWLGSGMD